ncbi:MAG: protein YhfH [Paenibacillaceae bacterium]
MITPMTDFFLELPSKTCTTCNHEIEEMADCYVTICNECNGSVYYPLSPIVILPK